MFIFPRWSLGSAALLTLGLAVSGVAPLVTSVPASGQATFPDVEPSHWAGSFIQALAERNIITGYPDGTYRPKQAVDRDEFAAIIRKAFSQNEVRQIPSGSVFKDVPADYWAAPPIEEAYESGFMSAYPDGYFRPREEVSRVDAIVSLVNNLNLSPETPQATTPQATTPQATTPQATTRRAAKKPIFLPLAITSLMQPLLIATANAQGVSPSRTPSTAASEEGGSPSRTPSNVTSDQGVSFNRPPSFIVSNYYTDAEQIPQNAVDEVAAATKANIVVNYPNVRVLNPNEPLSRGAAAALIYQTLVYQGKLEPLPNSVETSNYIVGSTESSNQTTQTTQ